ncbi:MAG: 4Fe-4S binding protein, partial [Eggerthellaceae bacterium]|nr:4Fe-4S binding protein [Eggerthellaceae bacterium]
AWGCPAPHIRSFFGRDPKKAAKKKAKKQLNGASTETDGQMDESGAAVVAASVEDGEEKAHAGCAPVQQTWSFVKSMKHVGKDKRTWVLGAVIIVTLIAGIPLFCLVCPIGLTFGTVGSLWHLFVDKQMTWSVLVFPAALAVELILIRVWCIKICPIAGLLNIFGQFAVKFRPKASKETCRMHAQGKSCSVCTAVCPENINIHAPDAVVQLGSCTRCGECARHCPTASISFTGKEKPAKAEAYETEALGEAVE